MSGKGLFVTTVLWGAHPVKGIKNVSDEVWTHERERNIFLQKKKKGQSTVYPFQQGTHDQWTDRETRGIREAGRVIRTLLHHDTGKTLTF